MTYCAGGPGGTCSAGASAGASGSANTGNGGGGGGGVAVSGNAAGGNGGSGLIVIAYSEAFPAPSQITGTYTQPTRAGYRVYRFTGSGSITF